MHVTTTNKPLLAAYLNMARNNCYMALSHIAELMGKSSVMNEDAIQECAVIRALAGNIKPDESFRIIDMVDQHFPFIRLLLKSRNNSSPTDYANCLTDFIKQLNELRNFHTHQLHKPYITDAKVVAQLQFLFDASRREVKKRFSLEEQDVKHLVRKSIVIIDNNKVAVEKENYVYAFANKEGQFTNKGIAFLISLFIEKKYAYLFLKQLSGFKNSNTKQHKATLEVFCFYHIRIPQPKLQSNNTKIGFLLDALEELKRCPAELYEHIAKNDKQRFKSAGITEDTNDQPEAILKRNGDRFSYLALRYLELTNSLPGLQFYFDLGKYYFKVYEKSIDSELRLRRLHKNMRDFGRTNDFDTVKMPQLWQQLIKRTDELSENYAEPYIVYTIPHYHIVNNQIGIWLNKERQMPSLTPKISNAEPQIWLSLYELPALLFYHLLTKGNKGQKNVLQILSKHRTAIHSFFKDIESSKLLPGFTIETLNVELEKRNLKHDKIPKPLLQYLLQQKPLKSIVEIAGERLSELQNETIFLLDKIDIDIEKAKEKIGGKHYRPIQTGKIADFLARDMLFFQPAIDKIKGKATSTLFQVLQARLAFYGRDKELLEGLYKECNLIQSKNPHPFLSGLPITNNLMDYYRNYLIKRNQYLDKCLKKCKQGKIGSQDFHFLHLGERERKNGNTYYTNLAGKFIKMPLNFPRGLFMEELINYFESSGDLHMQNIIKNTPRLSTTFLLKEYINNVLSDDTPDFYNWKRSYTVFNRYYDKRKQNSRDAITKIYFDTSQLSEEANKIKAAIKKIEKSDIKGAESIKRNYKFYGDNEKQLRQAKACDTILFLAIRDLFPTIESSVFKGLAIEQFRLSDILPDAEKGILSQSIEIRLPLYNKFIIQKGLKLKNYGDFRRFLKDRRLESLMPYFEEDDIDRSSLEKELEDYDTARIEIHRVVLDFESHVITMYQLNYLNPEDPCINHETILNCFFQNDPSDIRKQLMENIRNRFSHNEYPDFEKFKEIIQENHQQKTIAGKFVTLANQYFSVEE